MGPNLSLEYCPQGSGVNGIDTTHLLSVLEHTAKLLKDMGSPAREASAVAAHAAIRAELGDALQAEDSPALAAAVVKAVRVLMAQLKMLRMDAANFRLKMLAQSLKDGAGIRYRLLQCPSCRCCCTSHLVLRSLHSLVLSVLPVNCMLCIGSLLCMIVNIAQTASGC